MKPHLGIMEIPIPNEQKNALMVVRPAMNSQVRKRQYKTRKHNEKY
jgi:hypothetical protein